MTAAVLRGSMFFSLAEVVREIFSAQETTHKGKLPASVAVSDDEPYFGL